MKKLLLLILLYSQFLSAQTDTANYVVVSHGKVKGVQTVWKTSPKTYNYFYSYNDRGRGDSIATILKTNSSGNIISVNTNGVSYDKNSYAETFNVQDDSAVWIINGIRKAATFENKFYSVGDGGPAMMELLLKYLLQQPNRSASILPDGVAHAGEPLSKTISINNKPLNLKLYPVYFDPSPTPQYIWFDDSLNFFAAASAWFSTVKKGYESWTDSLFTWQELAGEGYYESQENANSKPQPSYILFRHANLFESSTATVKKNVDVEVRDGKINAIYPSQKAAVKADTVIDCTGKFLMPGLWDMHAHYNKEEGVMYMAGGVTHVRDMGNEKILLTYKKEIAGNKMLGPDLSYLSGFIDKEDPFQGPTGTIISSLDEGIKAIDDYHALGYQQIKLYSAIKPDWVAPMAAHAHSLGMRVCGHIPSFMTAEQAINAGYNEITHMNFIFLNFMGDTIDTRTPARFRLVGENAGKLDLNSKEVKDFIALMKEKHISLDPTLNVWQGMFDEFKGDTSNYLKPVVNWLPDAWKTDLAIQTPFGDDSNKADYKAAFANMMKMLKLLYDNGILLVAGTDGGEALAVHHELELYVQAGIPSNEVLKIATYNAALDCNLQDKYGSVMIGKDADLILVDGNPVYNISDIRKVQLVIKNNRMYQPKQLLQSQGWKYYY